MKSHAERLLAEAREVYAEDPERALELRRQVAASEISPAWSQAHVDLAAHEYGQANFEATADHAAKVLAAPAVDPTASAVAGILLCGAREAMEQAVDETLLTASVEAAAASGASYYAGTGLTQLARLLQLRGERSASKAAYARAVTLFDGSESMFAGPSALLRLATLESEDGDRDSARAHVEQALARLAALPLAGRSGHVLREKLTKLRDSLA